MSNKYTYRLLWTVMGLSLLGAGAAKAQSWMEASPLPEARYDISAVVLDDEIYVIGGRNRRGKVLDTVLRYRPSEDTWEEISAHLRTGRAEAAAAVVEGRIFIMGGLDDDGEILDDVEIFDPLEDRWLEVEELNVERYGHGATVINGRLYVIGGENEDQRLVEEVEVYDPDQDRWHVSSQWRMDRPRVAFALVTIGDTAYAFAGFGRLGQAVTPLRNADRFIPGNGVHQFQPDQVLGVRGNLAAATNGVDAYLLGGSGLRGVLDEVTVFTPGQEQRSDRWSAAPRMSTPRERFAAVIVGETLFAIGGRDSGDRHLASVERLEIATSVNTDTDVIDELAGARLEQNHPNPFSTSTTIPFVVSKTGHVEIDIYDLQGRLVERVLSAPRAPGRHEVFWDGPELSSGVYFVVFRQGESMDTRTLMRTR